MTHIRSSRGRRAAWRAVWTWPMHTRTRAVATCLATLVGLVLLGQSLATDEPPTPNPQAAPASSSPPTSPRPAAPETATSASAEPLPAPRVVRADGPPADPAALRTAAGFARNYARADVDEQAWRDGLRPYASGELWGQLGATDPQQAPSALDGTPRVVRAAGAVVVVDVGTQAPQPVRLTVIRIDGQWRVSTLEPARGA